MFSLWFHFSVNYCDIYFADLSGSFRSYVCSVSDGASCATVFSLLIQCLQRIPSVAESRSRQIIPLFLKFLGYSIEDLKRCILFFNYSF